MTTKQRDSRKLVSVRLDAELWKRVRSWSVVGGSPCATIVTEALEAWLESTEAYAAKLDARVEQRRESGAAPTVRELWQAQPQDTDPGRQAERVEKLGVAIRELRVEKDFDPA